MNNLDKEYRKLITPTREAIKELRRLGVDIPDPPEPPPLRKWKEGSKLWSWIIIILLSIAGVAWLGLLIWLLIMVI